MDTIIVMSMPIWFKFYMSCIFNLPLPFPLHFKFCKCLVIERAWQKVPLMGIRSIIIRAGHTIRDQAVGFYP